VYSLAIDSSGCVYAGASLLGDHLCRLHSTSMIVYEWMKHDWPLPCRTDGWISKCWCAKQSWHWTYLCPWGVPCATCNHYVYKICLGAGTPSSHCCRTELAHYSWRFPTHSMSFLKSETVPYIIAWYTTTSLVDANFLDRFPAHGIENGADEFLECFVVQFFNAIGDAFSAVWWFRSTSTQD
jgi:hypothetical protein